MRITHYRPEPGLTRFLGVEFRDGVAEVDELHPERRLALLQHGCTIIEEQLEPVEVEQPAPSARSPRQQPPTPPAETPKAPEQREPTATELEKRAEADEAEGGE